MKHSYDLAIIGAGIVGLGAALSAARQGYRVVVIERNVHAVGASIRNFGFVTITGQKAGAHWARARRSRDIWSEIVTDAGIDVLHNGLVMPAYRPEAADVLSAFLRTDMGDDCRLVTPQEAAELVPSLKLNGVEAILYSPHELRVESSEALPKLSAYLHSKHDVDFLWQTAAIGIRDNGVETSRGFINAAKVVVCPGDDFTALYPDRIAAYNLSVCTLQMLRIQPKTATRLKAAVMSDLSFARYEGFACLPEARPLAQRLDTEAAEARKAGIHLIAVQSADGSLIVGDSHVYGPAPQPFASERLDDLILDAFDDVFDLPGRRVTERWIGSYTCASDRTVLVDTPAENVRLVMVTGGTGASTAFALGEQVVEDLYETNDMNKRDFQ